MSSTNTLPEPFDTDVEKILAETIKRYEADSGKTLQPAHIERLIINTWGYRELLYRKQANYAFFQGFPQFAKGAALDAHGEQVAAIRLPAQPAIATLIFSVDRANISGDVTIAAGALISAGEQLFSTDSELTIAANQSAAEVSATCTTAGTEGNDFAIGHINTVETASITPNVDVSVSNRTVSNSGSSVETDEEYLVRILAAPEAFTTGTRGAYAFHARSVSQTIIDVDVDNPMDEQGEPIGGKVDITLLTKDGQPTTDLITTVQHYVRDEKRRDLCDVVTVKPPVVTYFSVTAELVLLAGADKNRVLARAESELGNYLSVQRQKLGLDIVPLAISAALKVDGVYNVNLSSPTLTVIPKNGFAVCESISLTVAAEVVDG